MILAAALVLLAAAGGGAAYALLVGEGGAATTIWRVGSGEHSLARFVSDVPKDASKAPEGQDFVPAPAK